MYVQNALCFITLWSTLLLLKDSIQKSLGGIAKYACIAYIQISKGYNQQLCHGSFTNNCQQSQEHFYVEEYLPYTDGSFFTSDTRLTSFSYWFINTFVYYKIIQLFIILNKFVFLNSICFFVQLHTFIVYIFSFHLSYFIDIYQLNIFMWCLLRTCSIWWLNQGH